MKKKLFALTLFLVVLMAVFCCTSCGTKELKLEKAPKPDDTADALAMAICHAHTSSSLMTKLKFMR